MVTQVWKKWGSSAASGMSKSLRAALLPRKGGAEWSCMRITGQAQKMQRSYECTLQDNGPGGLGFIGFKGTSRLVPAKGKKTCVRWARTKKLGSSKKRVCCPTFESKCDEKCQKSYNNVTANELYLATRQACDTKFQACTGEVPTHETTLKCQENRQDCLLAAVPSKLGIVNAHYDVKAFRSMSRTHPESIRNMRQYCQALWKNSKQEQEGSHKGAFHRFKVWPPGPGYFKYHFPAETAENLPVGVMDKPGKCKDGENVGAWWPEGKWGLSKPTRYEYCARGCQLLFPQKAGCPKDAVAQYDDVTLRRRYDPTSRRNDGKPLMKRMCMNRFDDDAEGIFTKCPPAKGDTSGLLWWNYTKEDQWTESGCKTQELPTELKAELVKRRRRTLSIMSRVAGTTISNLKKIPKVRKHAHEINLREANMAGSTVEQDEQDTVQTWVHMHQPYVGAYANIEQISAALAKAESELDILKLNAQTQSRRIGTMMDFASDLQEGQVSRSTGWWARARPPRIQM